MGAPRRKYGLFFRSSVAAARQLDELFDFMWPTTFALWNFRWQLEGYLKVHPGATEEELASRFISDTRINPPHKVTYRNLHKFSEGSWDDVREHLARFLLISSFAVFEGFLSEVSDELQLNVAQKKELCEPPFVHDSSGARIAMRGSLIPKLMGSNVLKRAIYPGLLSHEFNGLSRIEDLLSVYWAYKAVRNTLAHGPGDRALKQLSRLDTLVTEIDSIEAMPAVARSATYEAKYGSRVLIPFRRAPSGMPVVTMPSAVGFAGILRQLVYTYDAELSQCKRAERILKMRVAVEGHPSWQLRPPGPKRNGQIRTCMKVLGVTCAEKTPTGDPVAQLGDLFKDALRRGRKLRK